MSNSSLVSYTRLSPNYSRGRWYKITKITPHYMAGNLTVETCGNVFAPTSRQASSNYGIGSDGRIAMYVEEKNRAWTSSSAENDNRAVTIECANLADSSLTDACWKSLVNLCVDICRRNGIESLNYTGDSRGNLTEHRMFAATSCPGAFLHSHMKDLANEVNAILRGEEDKVEKVADGVYRLYNQYDGSHMFTDDYDEANALVKAGWTDEGIAFKTAKSGVDVYRMYNPYEGQHMFTTSTAEVGTMVVAGWTYEGVAWVSPKSGKDVYRLYNPNNGQHMFTASKTEKDSLVKAGWKDEGVVFKAN